MQKKPESMENMIVSVFWRLVNYTMYVEQSTWRVFFLRQMCLCGSAMFCLAISRQEGDFVQLSRFIQPNGNSDHCSTSHGERSNLYLLHLETRLMMKVCRHYTSY